MFKLIAVCWYFNCYDRYDSIGWYSLFRLDSMIIVVIFCHVESLFNAFATAAFFKFVVFSIFEMRYLLAIWKASRPLSNGEGWETMRRELSVLYSRFCKYLFGIEVSVTLCFCDLIVTHHHMFAAGLRTCLDWLI